METQEKRYVVRRLDDIDREKSTCGYRQRLFSSEDDTPAYFHVVKMSDSKPHYHKRSTEFYYVLQGEGKMTIDGKSFLLNEGTMVKIDPYAVHSTKGDMKVMVVGVPDIVEDDIFFPEEEV